jgi:hypothetical protein
VIKLFCQFLEGQNHKRGREKGAVGVASPEFPTGNYCGPSWNLERMQLAQAGPQECTRGRAAADHSCRLHACMHCGHKEGRSFVEIFSDEEKCMQLLPF